MRPAMCLTALLFTISLEAAGPPTALGPPATTGKPGYEFPILTFRSLLNDAAEDALDEAKKKLPSGFNLYWSGKKPSSCDYDCVGEPRRESTTFLNRPNHRYGIVHAQIRWMLESTTGLNIDIREITARVTFTATCDGWKDGSGSMRFNVHVDPPKISSGPGKLESVLDVLTGPLELSERIEEKLSAALASVKVPDHEGFTAGVPCATLGVRGHGATNQPQLDVFTWDAPRRDARLPLPSTRRRAIVSVDRIRHFSPPPLQLVDAPDPVPAERQPDPHHFTFYVNGTAVHFPASGSVTLAHGETIVPAGLQREIELPAKEHVQVILTDGTVTDWHDFTGDDLRTRTHRMKVNAKEMRPARAGGKPVEVWFPKYEIEYSIRLLPRRNTSAAR